MAIWWDKTLNMTLDTVSVLVTQYNNTAVTHTTTIYEDISSINISTFSEGQSLAFSVLTALDPEYEANGFALNNGTNAFVDGSFSVAYPTPFIGIQGFEFISVTQQDPHCPKGLQSGTDESECACMMQTYMEDPESLQYAYTSMITLSSTYYEIADPHPVNNDLGTMLEGPVPINNVSYYDFIESVLGSEGFNKYRSCAFLGAGVGPPALMIPVSALTATTTATAKSAGNYGNPSPKPGSPVAPVAPVAPTPTSTPAPLPVVPIVEPKPNIVPLPESSTAPYVAPPTVAPAAEPPVPIVNKPSPQQNPTNSPVNEPANAGNQGSAVTPSEDGGTDQVGSNGGQPGVEAPDNSKSDQSYTGAQPVAGEAPGNNDGAGSDTAEPKYTPGAAVVISYAGSSITPDSSSHYSIPQVGKLSPGGTPITTNNIVYSLAPSASALISNGKTILLPTYAATAPVTLEQAATPALIFDGSTYTADSSSRIVIAGQTMVPGGSAITVSSTPISLAQGAYMAFVGGSTQSLYNAVPTTYPELTFAGVTYTANAASAFAIEGQTLSPGDIITISSTPISLAGGGSFAVVAGSTQSLALAPAPTGPPTLTFNGLTFTANAASAFAIEGQTLSPGSIITVSNTPISLATDDSFAIVAGSTQSLAFAPAPTFTFNGSTFTAGTGSEFLIGSQTLTKGGVVTVAGTPISYASNGGDVVVGTSTEAVGIGGLIMSGFGNGGASATGPVEFTGSAIRCKGSLLRSVLWIPLGGILMLRLR